MESYRNKLKIQNIFSLIGLLVTITLLVLSAMQIIHPVVESDRWAAFWSGFISGVTGAVAACLLFGIARNLLAMGNEQKLRAQYIKAHDERTQRIWELSGASSYWFVTMGLLLAAIVAGYFNPLITIVIVCCIFYICIVRLILKIYYGKKL